MDGKGVARLVGALSNEEIIEYPHAQFSQQKKSVDMAHIIAVKMALFAGLRRGEVFGLSWEDVKFDTSELHVCHTLHKVTGRLKEPKTESGNRTTVLDSQTLADLGFW